MMLNLNSVKKSAMIFLFVLTCGVPSFLSAQNKETVTDPRDGHIYQTVTIGKQIWMAENLAYLPGVDRPATGLFEEECRYVYGYDGIKVEEARSLATFKEYGALYNWMAAKSACPSGWHLPTDQEWMELEKFLGMAADESQIRDWRITGETGIQLKSTAGWVRGNGTNKSGFSALPAGCRGYNGFESKGYCGYFWTGSTIDGDNGWRRGICSDSPGISRQEDRRYFGCSVRCVKN
jgi:uncharacterized protein (TIGR02145 family)